MRERQQDIQVEWVVVGEVCGHSFISDFSPVVGQDKN